MITPDLDPIVSKYPAGRRDALIPILQEVQEAHGYLSREAVVRIGRHLRLPASKVYGVATFYNQFRFQPPGRYHVKVCRGTACHVKGSLQMLDGHPAHAEGQARPDHARRPVQPGGGGVHRRVRPGPGDGVNGEFHAGVTSERVDEDPQDRCGGRQPANERRPLTPPFTPCCAECWHAAGTALPAAGRMPRRRPACCHENAACRNARAERGRVPPARSGRRGPSIFVGTGTCGLGAGAAKTLAAVRQLPRAATRTSRPTSSRSAASACARGADGRHAAARPTARQLPARHRASRSPACSTRVFAGAPFPVTPLGQFRQRADATPWAGRAVPGRASVLRAADALGAGQLRHHRPGEHRRVHRPRRLPALAKALREQTPAEVCDLVERAACAGRGGGGFPTGTKWKFAREAAGRPEVPDLQRRRGRSRARSWTARSSRATRTGCSKGMAIAAYAIGAIKAYIYIRAEYPLAIKRLKHAIAQAKAYGLLGRNILGQRLQPGDRRSRWAPARSCAARRPR